MVINSGDTDIEKIERHLLFSRGTHGWEGLEEKGWGGRDQDTKMGGGAADSSKRQ